MAQMPEHSETDEDLVERIQSADHEAFSMLVHRHTKMFYAAAYRVCSNQDDAEDIVQDAFLKLWNKPEIWNASRGAKFTTWFYRVVTNQAIDHLRKNRKAYSTDNLDYISDDRDSQLKTMEDQQDQSMLEEAIRELPERQMIALNLSFYEGLSNKETAEILGVGVKAVESLLMRAKAGLKDTLIRRGILPQEGKRYGS